MRLTHGEIRGVTALGVLLCCILGGMLVNRGCREDAAPAVDHELVEKMQLRADSCAAAEAAAGMAGADAMTPDAGNADMVHANAGMAPADSMAGRGAAKRKGSARAPKKEKTRRVVADRPSPLDNVNSH